MSVAHSVGSKENSDPINPQLEDSQWALLCRPLRRLLERCSPPINRSQSKDAERDHNQTRGGAKPLAHVEPAFSELCRDPSTARDDSRRQTPLRP
jgi:hypothetical protein